MRGGAGCAASAVPMARTRSGRPRFAVPASRTLPAWADEGGRVARVIVDVMLKPEIRDPQGEAIASACHRLGFGNVTSVRQGKRFEVEISDAAGEARAQVSKIAAELLANPVIEEFDVHAE
jgi:phosphoribosylformylglycinamidine synthase subunit PurS